VAVLGGREGMSRSLGSVYGGSVTRFLGGGLRGEESRVIMTNTRIAAICECSRTTPCHVNTTQTDSS
jgi:hypothetical protein